MSLANPAPIEHEGKILDIDPATTEQLILDKGGQKLREKFTRRYAYDINPDDTRSGSGCVTPTVRPR